MIWSCIPSCLITYVKNTSICMLWTSSVATDPPNCSIHNVQSLQMKVFIQVNKIFRNVYNTVKIIYTILVNYLLLVNREFIVVVIVTFFFFFSMKSHFQKKKCNAVCNLNIWIQKHVWHVILQKQKVLLFLLKVLRGAVITSIFRPFGHLLPVKCDLCLKFVRMMR